MCIRDSLKALSGEAKANTFDHEPIDLFDTNLTPNSSYEHEVALSYTCSELEEFSTENRHFYHLQLDSLENCTGWDLKLSLSQEMGGLSLDTKAVSYTHLTPFHQSDGFCSCSPASGK